MTKKFLVSFLFFFLALLFLIPREVQTHTSGSPSGKSGSPHDNATCAGTNCHSTPSQFQAGIITSDIPTTGYVPGSVYTITATLSDVNKVRFGFEISPQDAAGNELGSLSVTDTGATKLIGVGQKWITHKKNGTLGTGGRMWSFHWNAPPAGTGNVTFYGSFNFSNNDGHRTGDAIKTSTLTVSEHSDSNVGISNPSNLNTVHVMLYPNPASDFVNVDFGTIVTGDATVRLYDMSGKEQKLFSGFVSGETMAVDLTRTSLAAGLYFIQTTLGENVYLNKLIVQ